MDVGVPLDALGGGFLDRQTLLRSPAETRFTLWPRTSPTGLDEDLTLNLIYLSGREGASPGDQVLERVVAPAVALVPASDIREDPEASAVLEEGARLVTDATLGKVLYRVEPAATQGVTVDLKGDPQDPVFSENPRTVAFARVITNSRDEIVRARIVFREMRYARRPNVVHHEIGHTLGKTEDNAADFVADPQTYFRPLRDKALSVEDQRHRLVVSGSVELPLGFQLGAIVTYADGPPFNISMGTDWNGNGNTEQDRPDSLPTRDNVDQGTADTRPQNPAGPRGRGADGKLERNVGKGPDFFTIDPRLPRYSESEDQTDTLLHLFHQPPWKTSGLLNQASTIHRRELGDVDRRGTPKAGVLRTTEDIPGGTGPLQGLGKGDQDDRTDAALVEGIRLNDEGGPSVTRLRAEWLAEVGPPDLAASHYHFSRRRTSRDTASIAESSSEDTCEQTSFSLRVISSPECSFT